MSPGLGCWSESSGRSSGVSGVSHLQKQVKNKKVCEAVNSIDGTTLSDLFIAIVYCGDGS